MWPRRGRLNRRVSTLLVMADGATVAGPTSYPPVLAAAVLSVVLALQVGALLRRGGWQTSGLETRRGWEVRPLFAGPLMI